MPQGLLDSRCSSLTIYREAHTFWPLGVGGRVAFLCPVNDLKRTSWRHAASSFSTAFWPAPAAAGAAAFQPAAWDGTRICIWTRWRFAVSDGAWQPLCVFPSAGVVRG